ncbi:MAG: TetR/AcrR family transcriptional regulator [Candidatus Eiseniibacteriota bacterium]
MPDSAETPRRRWSRRKEARPAEIVAAALELFAERGFAATRLDDVAARAGVSKGTLYLYFESKEELFKAVVRESIVPNIARVEALLTSFAGPTPELIRTMVETIGMVVTTSSIGALPKLVIAEAGNFPDIARFYLEEVIHRGLGVMEAVLTRGIERGEFRPFDVRLSVRAVIAPVIVLAIWKNSFERFEAEPLDAKAYLTNHLDILMHGIAAPGATPDAQRGA